MIEFFVTYPSFAEEFFKRCLEKEAITYEERMAILHELMAEKKAVKGVFKGSKEGLIAKLSKKFNVTTIKRKKK